MKGKRWSDFDVEILRKYVDEGLSYERIAEKMGRTKAACQVAALSRGIRKNGKGRRHGDWWTEPEVEILRRHLLTGPSGAMAEIHRAGYVRTYAAVAAKLRTLTEGTILDWGHAKSLPISDFYKEMADLYKKIHGSKLTHEKLAAISCYSRSRIHHWFTSGSAQEPISMGTRHHFWALCMMWYLDYRMSNVGRKHTN